MTMAKKKKDQHDMVMPSISFKPPTTAQIVKTESRYLGEQIARNHPKVKKLQNEIASAVEKAVKKTLSGKAKSGNFEE